VSIEETVEYKQGGEGETTNMSSEGDSPRERLATPTLQEGGPAPNGNNESGQVELAPLVTNEMNVTK
jgi:hypothetical protein